MTPFIEFAGENDFKQTNDLPLARIKRIMKSDEDVRMISAGRSLFHVHIRVIITCTICYFAPFCHQLHLVPYGSWCINSFLYFLTAEAPVLFAKACELFILELTIRSVAQAAASDDVSSLILYYLSDLFLDPIGSHSSHSSLFSAGTFV